MAAHTVAIISLAIVLLLLVPAIDGEQNSDLGSSGTGYFNSHDDHNIGGSIAHQDVKDAFKLDAQSSARPGGAERQALHGLYSHNSEDGSNFKIRGGLEDVNNGQGHHQHTDTLGGSYTSPSGFDLDIQQTQSRDNYGHEGESFRGTLGYQDKNNAFSFGTQFSTHLSGQEAQTFQGSYSHNNEDGSNFKIRGGLEDVNNGRGHHQHTDTLGGSYTSPSGFDLDVQLTQSRDNYGREGESFRGTLGYQDDKNSFSFGTQSSTHTSGQEAQTFQGSYSHNNDDGSNLLIHGGIKDVSDGRGHHQHTDTLGSSYTSPRGLNIDLQHDQMEDTTGYQRTTDQIGVGHRFDSGVKAKIVYKQERDNNGHEWEGGQVVIECPFD